MLKSLTLFLFYLLITVIELVPQPIFVVPTEGITFNVIHGTKNGRIFLGGNDGSIHEINYKVCNQIIVECMTN